MQEIESGIYFESNFPGVTLGALTLSRGTILIDAPLRAEDARSWRAALLNRGSGIDRILINLDSHPDRTIGSRALECPVVAHERSAQVSRNRPPTFKGQNSEVGAEWETCTDLGSSRWANPDITFTEQMDFHWGSPIVQLEYHPGPAPGASWVVIPEKKIAFIGDAVVIGQPPFLADADIPAWAETLDLLLSAKYRNFILISGRGGEVTVEEIRNLRNILKKLDKKLTALWNSNAPLEEVYKLLPSLITDFDMPKTRAVLYEQRLRHGLQRYYNRHLQPVEEVEILEEE
jgi:glyoxylase-like metal-dependent hydrolase (beta-lactamase superfamily II)